MANLKTSKTHTWETKYMIKAYAPPPKTYVLPFATLSQGRREIFSAESETAAVYVLSEFERKDGGLLKQSKEKLSFIIKIGYPIWLVPRGEITYIFDGLINSAYTQAYLETPKISLLNADFEAAHRTREKFLAFLVEHADFFGQPVRKELKVNGLVRGAGFFEELEVYRKEASETTGSSSSLTLLKPIVQLEAAAAEANKLSGFYAEFREETEKLQSLILSISKAAAHHVSELQFEAEAVKDEAQAKIKAQEEIINPKIDALNCHYAKLIGSLTESYEKERAPLQKQKVKLEREIATLKAKIERYSKDAKKQAKKHYRYSEEKTKQKSKQAKKDLSVLEKELKIRDKKLKSLTERQSSEVLQLKFELDSKIKLERQPLLDIETSRDEKVKDLIIAIEQIEKQVKPVHEELARILKVREAEMARFQPLGVKSDPKVKDAALFYVPFYLACYQALSKRYFNFSPSTVSALNLSAKLKGAFSGSKIKGLFTPRFKSISALADAIPTLMQKNDLFEAEIEEVSQKNSIIGNSSLREEVKKGLDRLALEGWLSDKEHQLFIKSLR
jgi:hypothetical protein